MCLGPEFFDQRDAMMRDRTAKGEVEIQRFMRAKRLRFQVLYELGYFELNIESMTTADFFVHHIAKQAVGFFHQERDLQLIFVKPQRAAELASLLRKGVCAVANRPTERRSIL